MELGFARSRHFWHRFAAGTLVGLLGAVATFVFVLIAHSGEHWLWHHLGVEDSLAPLSGPWQIVAITTVAGTIVGTIYQFFPAGEPEVFEAIAEGHMDTKEVPGGMAVAVASLMGGFSLGPEAPAGMLAAAVAVWFSKWRKLPPDSQQTNILTGVVGAYSGVFTAPFGVIAMSLELRHRQTLAYYGTIAISAVAALLGFAVFFTLGGNRFAVLLRLIDLPNYQLQVWHIVLGGVLGAVSAGIALLFALSVKTCKKAFAPLAGQPVLRCTAVGFALGLLGMAMPVTLFLGSGALEAFTVERAELGVGFLVLSALLKLVATAVALGAGFIGGAIFPLFMVGGSLGIALWKLLPGLPVELTLGCMMAGVPGAIVPFPLTLGLIVMLITSTPVQDGIPVLTASLTAFFVFKGVLLASPPAPDAIAEENADPDSAPESAGRESSHESDHE